MERFIFAFTLLSLFQTQARAEVIVNTILPSEMGKFSLKITGVDTKEVIMTIPQCIGGLGILVQEGNQYTMEVQPNCTMEVPYETIKVK